MPRGLVQLHPNCLTCGCNWGIVETTQLYQSRLIQIVTKTTAPIQYTIWCGQCGREQSS